MTPSDDLQRLVERIEAASGPGRHLDWDIAVAVGKKDASDRPGMWAGVDQMLFVEGLPRYTASIDAAMTLVLEDARVILNISEDAITVAIVAGTQGCAATPALALASAALRSRITERQNDV